MSELIKVADVADVPAGQCKTVMAGDRELALCNVNGTFYAIDNMCPHQGGPLGEGFLDGTVVSCPWHGWRFDVCSGKSPVIPSAKVDAYAVVVEGTEVKVKLNGN